MLKVDTFIEQETVRA